LVLFLLDRFSENAPALNKEVKELLKTHRQKKKGRKFRKKSSKLNKECMLEKMHCFNHDNDHWRTAPFWTGKIRFLIS